MIVNIDFDSLVTFDCTYGAWDFESGKPRVRSKKYSMRFLAGTGRLSTVVRISHCH